MWCVAELTEEYVTKMEDVLETYERPYNPNEPVVCVDEKPVTLHADVRPPSPAQPGREARRDSEYERCGTGNVFCAVEPKAGRHFTYPTPDRSGFEFAQVACDLALQYPEAETIHLVMDNLNIHTSKSLTAAFGVWRRGRRRDLESIHGALHAHPWKLAQSGQNRNQSVCAAMSGEQTNPRPGDASPRGARLVSSRQLRATQDKLEVRPQSRPQVWLPEELF